MYELIKLILSNFAPAVLKPEPIETNGDPTIRRVVAVRDGYKLQELAPGKAASPGRRHVFADVPSFANFIRKHYPYGSAVEILADTTEIVAIDQAGWQRDQIRAVLTVHPDLLGWETLFRRPAKGDEPESKPLGQRRLFRELAARAHTLKDPEIVSAIQKVNITAGSEANFSLSQNGNYDVTHRGATTTVTTKLPGSFVVRTPIYLDGPSVDIEVALCIEGLDGSEPMFSLRPKNLDMAKLDAYRAEVAALRNDLGDGYLVGAGKLAIES